MSNKVNSKKLNIVRYPHSENKSLRAWNSADEYILKHINENEIKVKDVIIFNDRFGFLSSSLIDYSPKIIIDNKSQEKSIKSNITLNKLELSKCEFLTPLDNPNSPIELSIIKIPKSMDLFRLYLNQVSELLESESVIICGFMTKYFTSQMLDIAKEYFEEVEQSLAWKKSRILILSKPKQIKHSSIINEIRLNDNKNIQQYFGVFSAKNIDYATQYLIENINIKETDNIILDLASGNGVLAYAINERKANCEIHLVDDSILAVESSKLNLNGENIHFHYTDNLKEFDENYFDFIISNPPSHFEYETNIEISIELFRETKRILKTDGHFQLVASKHLNLKTHLVKIFSDVRISAENKKFIIYECCK
ncbi:MAG: methyltransferase [Melioribacteraceae bacterium]|nr:methyltransferase [Melioribacteraceae bacterium]